MNELEKVSNGVKLLMNVYCEFLGNFILFLGMLIAPSPHLKFFRLHVKHHTFLNADRCNLGGLQKLYAVHHCIWLQRLCNLRSMMQRSDLSRNKLHKPFPL